MNNKKNLLILTHWSYSDALIQNYTLPYLFLIRNFIPKENKIFLVTSENNYVEFNKKDKINTDKDLNKLNIYLLTQKYRRMGLMKLFFLFFDLIYLIYLINKEKIDTVHCFCTPAGSIGYVLSKITKIKLIIDSYEPHADSMMENGTWSKNSIAYKILKIFEKLQTKNAKYLIGTTASLKDYTEIKYKINLDNYFIKPACVDLNKFKIKHNNSYLVEKLKFKNKIVCVYAGKFGGIYLDYEIFDFIKVCYEYWGNDFRFLFLTNTKKEILLSQIERVNIPHEIIIFKYIDSNDVPLYLSTADFALNPVRPIPSKKYCTSIKDGEYWATGLPVVITKDISDDSDIINKTGYGYVLNELTSKEYFNAVLKIDNLINNKNIENIKKQIRILAEEYRNINNIEQIYRKIYS